MAKKFSKNVEVCLLKDIDTLGKKGDIKRVKMGYFANFLLPQKLAILAAKKVKAEKTYLPGLP